MMRLKRKSILHRPTKTYGVIGLVVENSSGAVSIFKALSSPDLIISCCSVRRIIITIMRKRERENPCGVCGHYHKYEEGEVCGICGHRMAVPTQASTLHVSAFSSEILPEFLYLGSYDNASRAELLKTQGISRILNTVPACQNLYRNSFTYHCLQEEKVLPFDEAIQFLEQCEKDKARVLVHCMSGKNRSPAIVIAFLMKRKGWPLTQSYQWVKDRRPSVELSQAVLEQLQEYEQKISGGPIESTILPGFPVSDAVSSGFGFPKTNNAPVAAFNSPATSIFDRATLNVPSQEFTFGASKNEKNVENPFTLTPSNTNDSMMDSS